MAKSFVAAPPEGFEGFIDDDGKSVPGIVTLFGEIYEPGHTPHPHARPKTLSELKAKFWDAATSSLRLPFGPHAFTIGPDVLAGVSEGALISIRIMLRSRADSVERSETTESCKLPPVSERVGYS